MIDELGWWAVRHLALDYFAGPGGSLGLREIETAEYFLLDDGQVATSRRGAHAAQPRYIEQPDPHRITVAIIESPPRGVPS